MAEAPVRAKRGDKVELELRNVGRVTGYVAWVAQGRFGVAFDYTIDPKLARKPVGQSKTRTASLSEDNIAKNPNHWVTVKSHARAASHSPDKLLDHSADRCIRPVLITRLNQEQNMAGPLAGINIVEFAGNWSRDPFAA